MPSPSPFLYPPPTTEESGLAILHLKRDSLIPVKLKTTSDEGYVEGAVTNTRFGSFPHPTLIGVQWGSQVRASKVDTGSRGRKGKKAQLEQGPLLQEKREQEQVQVQVQEQLQQQLQQQGQGQDEGEDDEQEHRSSRKRKTEGEEHDAAVSTNKKRKQQAQAHAQPPIEGCSGFIHVLQPTPESWTSSLDHRTQVVYTPDYSYVLQRLRVQPGSTLVEAGAGSGSFTHAAARAVFSGYPAESSTSPQKTGRVYSYEYHEPRVHTLRQEITDHGLDGIVNITLRDVCADGFLLADGISPHTDAIFLDLPAPWTALAHLTRTQPKSPLNPHNPIRLCTFSPCLEQVIATVAALRRAGWADVGMVEVQNKRIDVRRERIGLSEEGLRGVNATAASVEESINRVDVAQERKLQSKADRLEQIRRKAEERKLFLEGRLVHRTESEVKTHTSYLVFAVLPKEWSEEDESRAEVRYPVGEIMKSSLTDQREGKDDGAAEGKEALATDG